MQIKLYAVDQDTSNETFIQQCDLISCFPEADVSDDMDQDYYEALSQLKQSGRAWIGGGASGLFLALKA